MTFHNKDQFARRRPHALILLASFVVGGLLGPLTHYAFMSFSDVYGATPAESAEGHAHGHAVPVADAPEVGYSASGDDVFHCTYADLFATYAAAFAVSSVSVAPLIVTVAPPHNPTWINADIITSFRSRAPPFAG